MLNKQFILPYPPSVNKHLRPINYYDAAEKKWRKRQTTTQVWRDYKKNAANELMAQGRKRIDPTIELKAIIEIYPPDMRIRDCDNLSKVILDSLVAAGVCDDDYQICEQSIKRHKECLNCIKITLTAMEQI